MSDPTRRLRFILALLVGGLALVGAAVFGAVGYVVGLWPLLFVGVLAGGALGWFLVRRSADQVRNALGAVALRDAPRLVNLVDGICLAHGIPVPELLVVETSGSNVCVVGRRGGEASLIVTRGLVEGLGRIELEGVVARELALIKHGHAALATAIVPIARIWAAAPERLLPARADVAADVDAVGLTRYPPGLLDALTSIRADSTVPAAASWTRHLWMEDPVASASGRAGAYHSPIDERIATLREL